MTFARSVSEGVLRRGRRRRLAELVIGASELDEAPSPGTGVAPALQ